MSKSGLVAGMFAPAIIFPVIKTPASADNERTLGSRSSPTSAVAVVEHPSASIVSIIAKHD
jgi:hypothetical protein